MQCDWKIILLHTSNKNNSINLQPYFWDFYLFSSALILANDVVTNTVKEVGKQFQQAFMVEDTKKEVIAKVLALENRVNGKY